MKLTEEQKKFIEEVINVLVIAPEMIGDIAISAFLASLSIKNNFDKEQDEELKDFSKRHLLILRKNKIEKQIKENEKEQKS